MPGSAATTYGIALTQWLAVTTTPGLRTRPSSIAGGLQALEGDLHVGVAGDLDLEALALGAELPRRVEVLLAHQPVDGGGHDRDAVDQWRASGSGARRPGRARRRRSARRSARWRPRPPAPSRSRGSAAKPISATIIRTDGLEPAAEQRRPSGSTSASSGVHAEAHDVAHDVGGVVGADVAELLRAHVGDPGADQRRDHQREALGDAAGVDAGAVQRACRPRGRPPGSRRLRPRSG